MSRKGIYIASRVKNLLRYPFAYLPRIDDFERLDTSEGTGSLVIGVYGCYFFYFLLSTSGRTRVGDSQM